MSSFFDFWSGAGKGAKFPGEVFFSDFIFQDVFRRFFFCGCVCMCVGSNGGGMVFSLRQERPVVTVIAG